MAQTTAPTVAPAVGREGALYDAAPKDVVTKLCEQATGIKAGRVVVKGTADGQVVLPTGTAEITDGSTMGISVYDAAHTPAHLVAGSSAAAETEYGDEESIPVLKKGRVWMVAEDAVGQGDAVFVRHVAAGAENLGTVRSDVDGADATELPGARFESTTTGADELVVVALNLPF